MKSGPQKKPANLKILEGTYRGDRDNQGEQNQKTEIETPRPPNHFKAIHKKVWVEWCNQLMESNALTLEIKNLLIGYAWAVGEIQLMQKAGKETKAAMMTEIRRTGEYLASKINNAVNPKQQGNSGFSKFKK